jgi:excisionase family DNA binding protein
MPLSSSDSSPLLGVTEVCKYLRLHRITVYRMIKAGKLPALRVGGHWRLSRKEIELRLSPAMAIQSMTGRLVSEEEARRARSERMKRLWADPQYAAKVNRTKHISSEKQRQITELLQEKSLGSFSAVAKAVGVSTDTVIKIARQAGLEGCAPVKLRATMKAAGLTPNSASRKPKV